MLSAGLTPMISNSWVGQIAICIVGKCKTPKYNGQNNGRLDSGRLGVVPNYLNGHSCYKR